MVTNELFRKCLDAVPKEQKAEFDLSFDIAERLDALLRVKGIQGMNWHKEWVSVILRYQNGLQVVTI